MSQGQGFGIEVGRQAPYFSMVAAGSGRRVSLRSASGAPLVLVFHGRENAGVVREINHALRPHFPEPDSLTVASVIDLSFVPPFYWAVANLELDRAYRQAASELPPEASPSDYIAILPDWTGSTTRKFRIRNAGTGAVAVVVGADSRILGSCAGDDLGEEVLRALEK